MVDLEASLGDSSNCCKAELGALAIPYQEGRASGSYSASSR